MSETAKTITDAPGLAHVTFGTDGLSKDIDHYDMIMRRAAHVRAGFLFYHNPVNIVRGEGIWLYDNTGKRYLDCYNNVASVGHCNPKVVDAITKQAGVLNTHTRYLHEGIIDYAQELTTTMSGDLEVCYFVNSGSEANDLATRMAQAITGNHGVIVIENSYHGNSTVANDESTACTPGGVGRPDYIAAVEPPNTYRGPYRAGVDSDLGVKYAVFVDEAIETLNTRGHGVAAFMCDMIFDTQGAIEAPDDYFKEAYARVKAAGGLCIADEVQSGLCRTGEWWGYERYGVNPDIITLGKPMGDGHPVAAVVTTRAVADAFAKHVVYFNTFGGNPVSMAAGRAVLDVCKDTDMCSHVKSSGDYLRGKLEELAEKHAIVGNVQGAGLFLGLELVLDRDTREPASEIAKNIPDMMKDNGVLIGLTGRYGNVLKIRPPLVFSTENTDYLIPILDSVLTELT